jgi:hypothetical protein
MNLEKALETTEYTEYTEKERLAATEKQLRTPRWIGVLFATDSYIPCTPCIPWFESLVLG